MSLLFHTSKIPQTMEWICNGILLKEKQSFDGGELRPLPQTSAVVNAQVYSREPVKLDAT